MPTERPTRFNVILDEEHAAKLLMMAERAYMQPGALARSLLSGAIDAADPDPQLMTDILNVDPGLLGVMALERCRGSRSMQPDSA